VRAHEESLKHAQDAAKRGGLQNCDATRNSLWPWRCLRHTATSASPGRSGWPVAQGCQNLRDEQHFRLADLLRYDLEIRSRLSS
jgi:hypothetical protein